MFGGCPLNPRSGATTGPARATDVQRVANKTVPVMLDVPIGSAVSETHIRLSFAVTGDQNG
jgi:hypothetical protein